MHRHRHADPQRAVDINMCPFANIDIEVCGAEPLRRDGLCFTGLNCVHHSLADFVGNRPRLGRKIENQSQQSQRHGQRHIFCIFLHGGSPAVFAYYRRTVAQLLYKQSASCGRTFIIARFPAAGLWPQRLIQKGRSLVAKTSTL